MKDHCKNDCSRLQDVERTVLVIDIPKEMLKLLAISWASFHSSELKLLMTTIFCVDENAILCTLEPVDELSSATNLLETYQLGGNNNNKRKKKQKAPERIYITLSKCVMR